MNYNDFSIELSRIVPISNIISNALMKDYTSFKVGGPVDIMVSPDTYEEVRDIIRLCRKTGITFYIIGNGSNLLVRDGGIRGVVIKLTNLSKIRVEGEKLIVQSGAPFSATSREALKSNLTGLEFACGIPGSIGGAVAMNAGAYNGEVSQVIDSALVVDNEGNIRLLNKEELELGYRMSSILKYRYTVLEVIFALKKGEYHRINERIQELTKRRTEKQPLEYPSAGSTFKRPEGYFAPKLIEETGLKGLSVGGAEVSEKHSGFIINKGDATASDIIELIKLVQLKVREKFNVDLNTEVIIIGEDSKTQEVNN
jgi:UDP-N-acetylmuramate dehydrogenase